MNMNTDESVSLIKHYKEFEDMPLFQSGGDTAIKILQGLLEYGFETPSEIQQTAIVPMCEGRSLIAQAQSGTGKTGTFVIGSLQSLDMDCPHVQVIIVTPVHELATQTYHVLLEIGKRMINTDNVELCIGKQVSVEQNIININAGKTRILIGTPGRILHLVKHKVRGEYLIPRRFVRLVVLDEADRLLSDKSSNEVIEIVERLDDPRERKDVLQLGIFSATFNKRETLDTARRLCLPEFDSLMEEGRDWTQHQYAPVQILLRPAELTLDGIAQYYYEIECDDERKSFADKVAFIDALNAEHMIPVCMIYVNTANTAERLKDELNARGMACDCIYGNMLPKRRLEVTRSFRKLETKILISTDLLARGFDVQQIVLVINFDLPYVHDRRMGAVNPDKVADYLHRIGRSGRFGRKGVSINLVATTADMDRMKIIEEYYGLKVEPLPDNISELY
jgi:superfamily II DNA/RNA helicase